MALSIQTLNSKNEVIDTVAVDELTPMHAYVSYAIEQAKEVLVSDAFKEKNGRNVKVVDAFGRTVWMTYYGLIK